MDGFSVFAFVMLAFVSGLAFGSAWTYRAAKANTFADEGITYSYFNNRKFREKLYN